MKIKLSEYRIMVCHYRLALGHYRNAAGAHIFQQQRHVDEAEECMRHVHRIATWKGIPRLHAEKRCASFIQRRSNAVRYS